MDSLLAVMAGYALPGIAIAVGFLLLVARLPRKRALWLLGHPIYIEAITLVVAWMMHGGTLVGGMAVVCAGITMFITLNVARKVFGYIHNKTYHPGYYKYNPESLR